MSVNWFLAMVSVALWATAYAGYFRHDIRAWWWRRTHHRELLAIRRAQGHAAFLRRTSAARYRRWTPPAPPPRARAEERDPLAAAAVRPAAVSARPSAEIIPFPAGRRPRARE